MKLLHTLILCFRRAPYGGVTHDSGFKIEGGIWDVTVCTPHYSGEQGPQIRPPTATLVVMFLLIALWTLGAGWVSAGVWRFVVDGPALDFRPDQLVFYWAIGFIALGAGILFLNISHIFWGGIQREYHACEHKTIQLLSEKLEPSMEALKALPKTAFSCGSVYHMHFALGAILGGLFAIAGAYSANNTLAFITLALFLALLAEYFIFRRRIFWKRFLQKKIPFAFTLLFFAPFWIPIMAIEKYFVLKEPSAAVLAEGVEAAITFYAAEQTRLNRLRERFLSDT